ncbi:hypothetical protein IC006_0131 [Sulfuracidifex tepidarius]|uniref:Uncharacterized protein n=1 Tax=Sulfuracidifex tepidarius TaxID=1294262 RepID=A0A510DRN7_9CREN|nr:hypothetical protein [Sulfuracidifex tepidarius]BBG22847.1 hypothetical protein IC006_0131 [Sulfuracidifex tepidarius]
MLSSLKVKIILTEFDTEKVVKLAQASYFIILQRSSDVFKSFQLHLATSKHLTFEGQTPT